MLVGVVVATEDAVGCGFVAGGKGVVCATEPVGTTVDGTALAVAVAVAVAVGKAVAEAVAEGGAGAETTGAAEFVLVPDPVDPPLLEHAIGTHESSRIHEGTRLCMRAS